MSEAITRLTKYCSNCGVQIDYKAEICPKCGVRVAPIPSTGKNKVAAGVLAILLGGLGVHKFYLGKIGWGILYLLFFWTAIPAIAGLIEGIIYLTMSDADFTAKYDS
jgi:TM2 domain-containing membrane protein YozV/ribosomal protein S27AE